MNRIVVIWLIFFSVITLQALPGKIISYDQVTHVPIVSLNSLDLEHYKILKIFKIEDLPKESHWEQHVDYYANRNRTVYLTQDNKFVIKIWQKNYPPTVNFLSALYAGFYEGIALITGLIVDDEQCRGYITPYMLGTYNRETWESYGFVLEKDDIGVRIFSEYATQPVLYKEFFEKLLKNSQQTKFVSLDFCPNNIGINPEDLKMYLFDLEDVQPLNMIKNSLIRQIYFPYNPHDYLKKLENTMIEIKPIELHQIEEVKKVIITSAFEIFKPSEPFEEFEKKVNTAEEFKDINTVQESYLNNGIFLVLLDNNKVVGSGAIRALSNDICELKRMWFLKEYRGRGLGKLMTHKLLAFAQEKQYKKMRLDVYRPDVQEGAVVFYKKLGFYEIEPYNSSQAKLFMEKIL